MNSLIVTLRQNALTAAKSVWGEIQEGSFGGMVRWEFGGKLSLETQYHRRKLTSEPAEVLVLIDDSYVSEPGKTQFFR